MIDEERHSGKIVLIALVTVLVLVLVPVVVFRWRAKEVIEEEGTIPLPPGRAAPVLLPIGSRVQAPPPSPRKWGEDVFCRKPVSPT